MNIALGTANLGEKYNQSYQEIVEHCISKNFPLHISLDYKVNKKYLTTNKINKNKITFILKLTLTKNIFKLKKHIKKQIEEFQANYDIKNIGCIQLCNNPNKNFIYQKVLKKIIYDYKKKGVISRVYLDLFPDYEKNLKYLIDDEFYDGFVCLFNFQLRSVSKDFFNQIVNSKKKIVIYSPLSSGEQFIEKSIISNEDILINILNFFYTLSKSIDYIVFGTKKIERIKFLEIFFKTKNKFLDNKDIDDIISKQKIYNKY